MSKSSRVRYCSDFDKVVLLANFGKAATRKRFGHSLADCAQKSADGRVQRTSTAATGTSTGGRSSLSDDDCSCVVVPGERFRTCGVCSTQTQASVSQMTRSLASCSVHATGPYRCVLVGQIVNHFPNHVSTCLARSLSMPMRCLWPGVNAVRVDSQGSDGEEHQALPPRAGEGGQSAGGKGQLRQLRISRWVSGSARGPGPHEAGCLLGVWCGQTYSRRRSRCQPTTAW